MSNKIHTWEITTGANFFYTRGKEPICVHYTIELSENVNKDILGVAARLTMERFPYFSTKLTPNDTGDRYVLQTNIKPFVVYEQPDFLKLGTDESNDYLITLCFSESTLYICFHHGLTDAFGMNHFIKTLLYTYFCKRMKREFQCLDLMNPYELPLPPC